MGITRSGTTITIDDYPSSSPCTLQDIYNADIAGGWGVVSKIGSNMFYVAGTLYFGLGTNDTYFTSKDEHLVCSVALRMRGGAYLQFGDINANGNTFDGCFVEVLGTSDIATFGNLNATSFCSIKIYDTKLSVPNARVILGLDTTGIIDLRGSLIETLGFAVYSAGSIFKNTKITGMGTLPFGLRAVLTEPVSGITIQDSIYGIYPFQAFACTFRNCIIKDTTYDWYMNTTVEHDAIDVIGSWTINWPGTNATAKLNRKYTVNVKVLDDDNNAITNSSVIVVDKDGNEIFSELTDSNGDIAEQEVRYGYYNYANRPNIVIDSPHTLTINKQGYETVISKLNIDNPTSLVVTLKDIQPVLIGINGQTAIKLDPSNSGVNRDKCIIS